MKTKLIILHLLVIFLAAPIALFAQELETIISADQITVQPDNILKAKGNVIVRRGDVSIKAEAMTVDERKNQIEFGDSIEFFDGKSLKLAGKNAVISDDLSAGIIKAAKIVIDDTIKIRAEEIKLKNSTVERIVNINQMTSCEECENGSPLWYFTASSATNDIQNKNIIYRNVTLRLSGLPLVYIPYLRIPNPDVNRARGFLVPGLNITSNLGVGVKLPYFIPIGESRDLLLTPYLSSKTKTVEYRYRQKTSNGDIKINGAFSFDEISKGDLRSFYRASGSFKLYGINLKIEAGQTNDNAYLEDYAYDFADDLNTEITLGKELLNQDTIFRGKLNYLRENKDDNSLEEIYLLDSEYTKRVTQTFFPGNLYFGFEGNSSLNVSHVGEVRRPPSSFASGIRYSSYRYAGPVQILDQSFAQLTSLVNSENANGVRDEFLVQYGVSTNLSIPLHRRKTNVAHQFIPKFTISYNGQDGRAKGDSFVGENQLSFGNLYNGKKFSSLSESELGFSVSGGLDYRIRWNRERALGLRFGGAWLQGATTIPDQKGQLEPQNFIYIGGFDYQTNQNVFVSGDALIDDRGKILNGSILSKIDFKDLNLTGRYEFIDAQTDDRINEDLENINLSASYEGFDNFSFAAAGRYDLTVSSMASSTSSFNVKTSYGIWDYQFSQTFKSNKPEKTTISAIYDDECTNIRLSLQNTSQSLVYSDGIQSIEVLIRLKPLTNFSVPGLD